MENLNRNLKFPLFTYVYHHPITWEVQLLAISFLLKKQRASKISLANGCFVQTQAGCAQEPSRSTKPQSLVHLPVDCDFESLDVQNTKDWGMSSTDISILFTCINASENGVAVWRRIEIEMTFWKVSRQDIFY